jgi:hypothetical protein
LGSEAECFSILTDPFQKNVQRIQETVERVFMFGVVAARRPNANSSANWSLFYVSKEFTRYVEHMCPF